MKYLKLFNTHDEYNAFIATTDLLLPNVSHCIQEADVHYNPIASQIQTLMVTYNVSNASNPTLLYGYYAEEGYEEDWTLGVNMFDKVEIDGTEVSVADLDANSGGYQLSVGEHTVEYTLKDPTLIGAITDEQTHAITRYGAVFIECSAITSVTIPSSVTAIGDYAFHGCTGLTSVTIPNGVTSIGNSAFHGCTGLTSIGPVGSGASIEIPNSVTSIGVSAFSGCTGLTSITIPSSVTSIGDGAFHGCTGLTSVEIPSGVTSIGGGAFAGCSGFTTVTIPNTVTSIGGGVFSGCTGLTSVTIPNSVTSIGDSTFNKCSGLTSVGPVGSGNSVEIPSSVTSIGDYAFYKCTGLTTVTIPSSVTSIGEESFSGCSNLTTVTIPSSVTSIDRFAFSGCSSLPVENNIRYADTYLIEAVDKTLSTYTIKEGTRFIGVSSFNNCVNLTNITFPSSIISISECAFSGCTSLPVENNIRYADTVAVRVADKTLSTYTLKQGTVIISCSAFDSCTSLTTINIPNSVTSIGSYAFNLCSSLTSVTIPNSVTKIDSSAFYGCTSLTSVTIQSSATSIGYQAFCKCPLDATSKAAVEAINPDATRCPS